MIGNLCNKCARGLTVLTDEIKICKHCSITYWKTALLMRELKPQDIPMPKGDTVVPWEDVHAWADGMILQKLLEVTEREAKEGKEIDSIFR